MRKFVIPSAVLAAAVALIVLLTYGVSSHADTQSIDAQVARHHYPRAPSYTTKLPLLGTDRTLSLSAFRGRYVVLNMFASWCDPCHAEAPLMAKEERFLNAHHAVLVGVAYRDLSSSDESFDRHYGLHEPVLRDVSGNFAQSFGTFQVPETFVINPQGRIVALQREQIDRRWLDEHVQPLVTRRS